jgi:hypothetical protein
MNPCISSIGSQGERSSAEFLGLTQDTSWLRRQLDAGQERGSGPVFTRLRQLSWSGHGAFCQVCGQSQHRIFPVLPDPEQEICLPGQGTARVRSVEEEKKDRHQRVWRFSGLFRS